MLAWERSTFDSPFELWREQGVLHLTVRGGAVLMAREMKEVIRLVAALDPDGRAPVLLECREGVRVNEDARNLLRRACGQQGHPVALLTADLDMRLQGELFKHVQRPAFPFRVFGWREEAMRWVRDRRQLGVFEDRSPDR